MQTVPETARGTGTMARGGSGSAAPAAGAATFRLTEGATMTLPDGCTATVRQGALELSDGQRLALPEAGGSVTIERRVVRPDGRAALVRHTIRVGEVSAAKSDGDSTPPGDKGTAEVSEKDNKETAEVPVPDDKVIAQGPEQDKNTAEGPAQDYTTSSEAPAENKGTVEGPVQDNATSPEVPAQDDKETAEVPPQENTATAEVPTPEDKGTAEASAQNDTVASEEPVLVPGSAAAAEVPVEAGDVPTDIPVSEDEKATEVLENSNKALPEEPILTNAAPIEVPVPANDIPARKQASTDNTPSELPEAQTEEPESTNDASSKEPVKNDVTPAEQPVPANETQAEEPVSTNESSDEVKELIDQDSTEAPAPSHGKSQEVPVPAESDVILPANVITTATEDAASSKEAPNEEQTESANVPDESLTESPSEESTAPSTNSSKETPSDVSEIAEKLSPAEAKNNRPSESATLSSAKDSTCMPVEEPSEALMQDQTGSPAETRCETTEEVKDTTPEKADETQRDEVPKLPAQILLEEKRGNDAESVDANDSRCKTDIPSENQSQGMQPSASGSSSSPLRSSLKECLTPVAEDQEPSFDNNAAKLSDSKQPFCEWTSNNSIETNEPDAAAQVDKSDADKTSSQGERSEECDTTKKTEAETEDEKEPVIEHRLAHHDSLRLPTHVPRLRRRSEDEGGQIDRHSPCGRKAVAHLKDPFKKREEDEAMRNKLNSILHKLGYGIYGSEGDDKERASGEGGGTEAAGPKQHGPSGESVEGPEEPEPVSVPKVISYFESITPQRMESPVEKRKWRSSDRSPSALRAQRSARSPEPSRSMEKSPGKQSPSLRRVNFAHSAQRVLISSTSEPDEMEHIPIPHHEDSSPEIIQPCQREVQPVVTSQPTRLNTILAQSPPDNNSEDPLTASDTTGDRTKDEDLPKIPATPEKDTGEPSDIQKREASPQALVSSVTEVNRGETEPSKSTPNESPATQSKDSVDSPGPDETAEASETTPLITSSTAEELNQPTSGGDSKADSGVTPLQAEPLPRPSSVVIQGELPLRDFTTSRTGDPTELEEGASPVLLIDEGTEEAVDGGARDPFLPDGVADRRDTVSKSSSWFEDCLSFCCCCWGP
ncbi:cell surface glycoprotein 1-like [Amphibalanus amphitrite]|uniref:cell surface glycoprotein 1-like n=1 Tax=Amphibalanus amphitrite TaxID=1232801 RepID=UPI001C92416B|nr:cell surface glycoprotein 1-like [Amphibalanus amphitrite]